MIGYYLTHPQVEIDPSIPVPEWSLSAVGRARVEAIRSRSWLKTVTRIVCSAERKAVETASIIARDIRINPEAITAMGENDRTATGFLEPRTFEQAADRFFGEPAKSWMGWERAIDAQDRIVRAVDEVLQMHEPSKPILFVGHGAVGTLLKCRLANLAISRDEDQHGGGNIFAFSLANRRLLCDWTPMETFEGIPDAERNDA